MNNWPATLLRSTWVMLNTEKRRAVRIPDEMRVKLYAYTPQPLRCASCPRNGCKPWPRRQFPALSAMVCTACASSCSKQRLM